jgi:hypothetical protein
MFTGRISEVDMLEDHPLELADIKAGDAVPPDDPDRLRRRRRIFIPVFAVVAAALLSGIFAFVTFEQTAITTLPPGEQVEVFVPLTPTPLPTRLPTEVPPTPVSITWDGGIGALFADRCGACHSGSAPMAGLDLSSYEGIMAGGSSGAVVVPGDPDASLAVIRQESGDHPGQFSEEELALVRQWISEGAVE